MNKGNYTSSLLRKLTIPYGIGFVLIAFTFLYAIPERQRLVLLEDLMAGIEGFSKTIATSVTIAVEEEEFSSLSTINSLLASRTDVSFAAIYTIEDDSEVLFAIYPNELEDDGFFKRDPSRYLTQRHTIDTDILCGYVIVGYDILLFAERAFQLNIPVYIAFAFIFAIQLWVYRSISTAVVSPIRKAATIADSLGSGALDTPVAQPTRQDEVGLLYASL